MPGKEGSKPIVSAAATVNGERSAGGASQQPQVLV